MTSLTYSKTPRFVELYVRCHTSYDICTTIMKICLGLTSDCRVHKAVLVIQTLV